MSPSRSRVLSQSTSTRSGTRSRALAGTTPICMHCLTTDIVANCFVIPVREGQNCILLARLPGPRNLITFLCNCTSTSLAPTWMAISVTVVTAVTVSTQLAVTVGVAESMNTTCS